MYKYDIKIYGTHKRESQIQKNKTILHLTDNDIFYVQPEDGPMPYPITKRAFMSAATLDTTHRLVLQDDAELCPNFEFYLQKIIEDRPNDIIFLVALDYPKQDDYIDNIASPYCHLSHMIQGCAIIMPISIIKDCFDWIEVNFPHVAVGEPHEDSAIVTYGLMHNIQVINTIPSIVQHIGDNSTLFDIHTPSRTFYFKDWENGKWGNNWISPNKEEHDRQLWFQQHKRR